MYTWNMDVSPDYTKEKERNVRSHPNSTHIAVKTIFSKLLLFAMHIEVHRTFAFMAVLLSAQ